MMFLKKRKRIVIGVALFCVCCLLVFIILLNNSQSSADAVLDSTPNQLNKESVRNLDSVSKPSKHQCDTLPVSIDPADDALMDLALKCASEKPANKTYIKLPPFVMPNLVWKDKILTINGKQVVYKFGEGNPRETALDINGYNGRNGVYIDYVTPEVERNLYKFLADPELKYMVERCGSVLGRNKVDINLPLIHNSAAVLDHKVLDIENILKIDQETGRKFLDDEVIVPLLNVFKVLEGSSYRGGAVPIKNNCYSEKDFFKLQNLYLNLAATTKSYVNNSPLYSARNALLMLKSKV